MAWAALCRKKIIIMQVRFLCVVLVVLCCTHVSGQKKNDFEQYKNRYPDKQAIMIQKKEVVKIGLGKNDSIEVSLNYYSEMLHLSDRTEGFAESTIPFSDFVELKDVEAKTLVPFKSSFKTVKVTDYTTKNSNSSGIFFDDNKVKVFTYPGVQPGAKTILSYTQTFHDSKLLAPYYFNFYVPVVQSEITIMVDKRLKLGYRLFNNKDSKIKFTESNEGNFTVYKWLSNDLSEYVVEADAPSISFHEPHIIYFIEEIQTKGRNEVLLKDTKDLYRWYYGMAIKNQSVVGPELKSIVDSTIAGATSDKEKTKRIYNWVQDHVKYVAFEDGYGGFIPRDANLVCDRRFGDCKDMANLLVKMLNMAGVPAYHTWIGTRDIPYTYNQVPTTNVDNHMIAAVKIDGKYVFLDATGQYGTLEHHTSMIQGKEALIGIDAVNFEIVKVSVLEAVKNQVIDSTFCSIENGMLTGKGSVSFTGYNKIDNTYALKYVKKEDQKEKVKNITTKGSNKFSLISYEIKNLDSKEQPLIVDYEFALSDYIKTSSGETYINLNLDRTFDRDRIDTMKRKLSIVRDYKFIYKDVIVFNIPVNSSVEYLPTPVREKTDFFDLEIDYKIEQRKIIYTKKLTMNTLLLEKKNFSEWNNCINKLSQAYREVVVLKQK